MPPHMGAALASTGGVTTSLDSMAAYKQRCSWQSKRSLCARGISLSVLQDSCWARPLTFPTISCFTLSVFLVNFKAKGPGQEIDHLDFKIVVEPKDSPSYTVILVASSRQEKAAWTSDISQVRAWKHKTPPPTGMPRRGEGPDARPATALLPSFAALGLSIVLTGACPPHFPKYEEGPGVAHPVFVSLGEGSLLALMAFYHTFKNLFNSLFFYNVLNLCLFYFYEPP